MTLLEKCNADVFKDILDIKRKDLVIGEKLIFILQKHESSFDLTCSDMLWFSANLPYEIWNGKVHTFHLLFQSQQTTEMP
jgi:hypothetical protein